MMIDRADTHAGDPPHRRYNSFLLRCWHVGDGELRIKLEHIQSGNAVQVDTYEVATAWLSEHCARLGVEHSASGRQPSLGDDESRCGSVPNAVPEPE